MQEVGKEEIEFMDLETELNHILWENIDTENENSRPMNIKLQENLLGFISQKLQEQEKQFEIDLAIYKKALKLERDYSREIYQEWKKMKNQKKEIVEMIEKFFNEKETMSYYLSDELTDKIKNI